MVSVQIDIQNFAITAPFVFFMKVVNSAVCTFCEAVSKAYQGRKEGGKGYGDGGGGGRDYIPIATLSPPE